MEEIPLFWRIERKTPLVGELMIKSQGWRSYRVAYDDVSFCFLVSLLP